MLALSAKLNARSLRPAEPARGYLDSMIRCTSVVVSNRCNSVPFLAIHVRFWTRTAAGAMQLGFASGIDCTMDARGTAAPANPA